ncbi:MAG: hypothetical protein NTY61_03575 [Candidatus Parcubacteria bacterium]|nr:hypothetical protein [Candidatus Parcubacteria bacterium]
MLPINIKINRPKTNEANPESPNILDLNNQLNNSQPKNPLKKYIWLLLVLLAGEALLITAVYFKQPISPYLKFFPNGIIATSYFNHSQISDLFKSLKGQGYDLSIFNWTENEFKTLLEKTKIESTDTILSLFQDQTALVLLPASGRHLNWMIFASVKVNSDQFNETKNKTERAIKQNFNITNESYRQIQITRIQNLDQGSNSLYYAKVNNYFVATNNLDRLKESIDLVVK